MSKAADVEQYLSERGCFIYSNGNWATLGAYLQLLDYDVLKEVVEEDQFTRDDWQAFITYCVDHGYLGPGFRLVAAATTRYVNQKLEREFQFDGIAYEPVSDAKILQCP